MKLLIDADVLLRAALFPSGEAHAALQKALAAPFQPCVREAVFDELRQRIGEKFPSAAAAAEDYLSALQETVTVLPEAEGDGRSPLDDSVNLFLTGDGALLALSEKEPRILSAAEFLRF